MEPCIDVFAWLREAALHVCMSSLNAARQGEEEAEAVSMEPRACLVRRGRGGEGATPPAVMAVAGAELQSLSPLMSPC